MHTRRFTLADLLVQILATRQRTRTASAHISWFLGPLERSSKAKDREPIDSIPLFGGAMPVRFTPLLSHGRPSPPRGTIGYTRRVSSRRWRR
jgi:hypothetical protein